MANENTPPKDLEVRLTELENAVSALTQALQPTAGAQAQIPQICAPCSICTTCFHCTTCIHCLVCRPICTICRPICAECNGCIPSL